MHPLLRPDRYSPRPGALLALILLIVGALLATAIPATAAAESVTVTLQRAVVNPALGPVAFDVVLPEGDGPFVTIRLSRGEDTRLQTATESGTLTFPDLADGDWTAWAYRCGDPDPDRCTLVTSFSVRVLRRIRVDLGWEAERVLGPGERRIPLEIGYESPTAQFDLQWRLVDTVRSTVVAEGSLQTPSSFPVLTVVVPEGVRHGRGYELEVDAVLTEDGLGPLEGRLDAPLSMDAVFDKIRLLKSPTEFFPVRDDYLDHATFFLNIKDPREAPGVFVRITDAAGRVVRAQRGMSTFTWGGTDAGGDLVPAGLYDLEFEARDTLGNTGVVRTQVRVRRERQVRTTTVVRASARELMVDRYVGRCSTLRTSGDGALTLESQTRCRTAARSAVVAAFGVALPPISSGRLAAATEVSVEVAGDGLPGRRSPYLVAGWIDPDGGFQRRTVFTGRGRDILTGDTRTVRRVVHGKDDRAIYWQLGLSEGSRWQVRGFTVRIEHWALRLP